MKIIFNKHKLIKIIEKEKNLGFVPTMGSLHKGHSFLIKKSNSQCKKTIVSIFVNKPQFNKFADFKKYPRTLSKDVKTLKKLKVDFLYLPSFKEIYPYGTNRKIKMHKFSKVLCGKFRPGHFKAVIDVVDRFIRIINPKKIFLGEKDFQQLKLIKKVIKKNILPIKLISCPSIRLNNGMSMSSRYNNFSLKEKKILDKIAIKINSCVKELRKNINLSFLEKLNQELRNYDVNKIDYLEIREEENLQLTEKKTKARLFIAFYLGEIRIIDNFILY